MSIPKLFRVAVIAVVAALTSAATFAPAQAQDATRLLRNAVMAYSKYSYVGQVQNVDFGTAHADAVLFRIEHRAPDLTRRWYLAPESLYGDSIISKGDTSYDVDTHHKRVIVVRDDALADQVAEDDNFGLLLHNYRAVMGPEENVAGRRAYTVLLINKYTGANVLRIWLDAETNLVLQKERYSASGSVAHQMRFENIRYEANIPSDLFNVPTAGYTRVIGPSHGLPSNDLQAVVRNAGFEALGPKYLPEGFLPIAGDLSEVKGVRMLHLLYSDGLRTVSLFENAKGAAVDLSHYPVHQTNVRSHDAQYVMDGHTTLLAWSEGNLHLALVGELSHPEMTRIASSVGAP